MKKTRIKAEKLNKLLKWMFLLSISISFKGYAQDVEIYDYHDPNETYSLPKNDALSENGGVHTPKGPLKVLLVFAQFEGDNYNETNENWPKDQLPNYSDILYTSLSDFNPNNTDLSISNYYYQMSKYSGNRFQLYGEIFPELVQIAVPTTDFTFAHFTDQVFDYIDANYNNYNWDTFDQRTNNPNYASSNVSSSPDNKFDYVVISFRWNGGRDPWNAATTDLQTAYEARWGGSPTGWAAIANQTLSTSTGTYNVTSGFTSAKGLMSPTGFREFFFHEFGHNLYNAPHYNGANSVVGQHFYTNSGWGMMGSGARHKYCTLGWEQWWLGWNDINYDLNNSSQNGTYTLYDFITNGDMMRLKIPNTDQYVWLEFHSGQSVFENRGSLTTNKQGNTFPENADGVLAYVECISDDKSSPGIFSSGANGIKYIHGEGNYEYNHSTSATVEPEWWPAVYDFFQGEANPFAMQNGVSAIRSDYDSDNKINYNTGTNSPNSGDGNEMNSIVRKNGTMSYDTYGKNMNLKVGSYYSVSSNPAIIEHQTYSESSQELSPIRLHGLRIKIVSQTSTYARIQVEYDYDKVYGNVRWTGNIELPDNQTLTLVSSDITIDRSNVPSRETPDATFGFYPYSKFVLKNGSELNIPSYNSLKIKENSTIEFENGSDLNVTGGSLTLDAGCEMVFNAGTYEINNSGTIYLNGNVVLDANAKVVIKGSGKIILNGNFNASSGATLTIEGVAQGTTLAEVNGKIDFDTDLTNVTIKNGSIQMNNSNAELYFNSGIDNITLDNISVYGYYGQTHNSVDIRSNGNVTIKNSKFQNGVYGLYASRSSSSPNIDIDNCTFKKNTYGCRIYNGGINMDGCLLEYNTARGLYCTSMDKQSYINSNIIRYQNGSSDYGLYYEGSSTATLNLGTNHILYNYYGVRLYGSFTTILKCNDVKYNTSYGLFVYNSDIYLADASGIDAGENVLYSNSHAIKIDGSYASFLLNNGNNSLVSDNMCMTGTLSSIAGGTLYCNNNYWKSGGGSPVRNINYTLNGGVTYFTLIDYSPNSRNPVCEGIINPGLMKVSTSYAPVEIDYEYQDVTTSIGNYPLNEAVNRIANSDPEFGKVFDLETRFDLLAELLNKDISITNEAESWYLKHAYNLLKTYYGNFNKKKGSEFVEEKLTNDISKIVHKLEKDLDKKESKFEKNPKRNIKYVIDEANILWYAGEYNSAIELLEKIKLSKLSEDDACFVSKMICKIGVDKAFIKSNNTLDVDKLLSVCEECEDSRKSGSILNNESEDLDIDSKIDLDVIPNPVIDVSQILITGITENGEVTIYNSVGAVVFNEIINADFFTHDVYKNDMKTGIYLISVKENGQIVKTTKMVINN